jgi:hypothetical protein
MPTYALQFLYTSHDRRAGAYHVGHLAHTVASSLVAEQNFIMVNYLEVRMICPSAACITTRS